MSTTSSRKYRRLVLAGASVLAVGATSIVALNAVSATNLGANEDEPVLPTDCEIGLLEVPEDSSMSIVTAIDPTGTYIAGRSYPDDPHNDFFRQTLLWENGDLIEVDFPGSDQTIQDVNSHGDAVGYSFDPDTDLEHYSYAFVDGDVIELDPEVQSYAWAINDDGTIVGDIRRDDDRIAVTFTDNGSEPLELPEDGVTSGAVDIDNDGSIFGYVAFDGPEPDVRPYRWDPDGTPVELTFSDDSDFELGSVASMTEGWATAYAFDEDTIEATVLWAPGETEGELVEFGGMNAVNGHGWLVGSSNNLGAVYADGELYELPSLNDDPEILDRADGMSNDGTVIAGSVNWDLELEASLEAAVWNCE